MYFPLFQITLINNELHETFKFPCKDEDIRSSSNEDPSNNAHGDHLVRKASLFDVDFMVVAVAVLASVEFGFEPFHVMGVLEHLIQFQFRGFMVGVDSCSDHPHAFFLLAIHAVSDESLKAFYSLVSVGAIFVEFFTTSSIHLTAATVAVDLMMMVWFWQSSGQEHRGEQHRN